MEEGVGKIRSNPFSHARTHKCTLTHTNADARILTCTRAGREEAHRCYIDVKIEEVRFFPLTFTFNFPRIPKSLPKKKSTPGKEKRQCIANRPDPVWWMDLAHCQRLRRVVGRESRLVQAFSPLLHSAASRRSPAAAAKNTGCETMSLFPFTQKKRLILVQTQEITFFFYRCVSVFLSRSRSLSPSSFYRSRNNAPGRTMTHARLSSPTSPKDRRRRKVRLSAGKERNGSSRARGDVCPLR